MALRVAVLGTGRMGGALARTYARAGHEVWIGSRDATRGERAAAELAEAVPGARARGGDLGSAVAGGEIVVMATPAFSRAEGLVDLLRGALGGKVLLDISNTRPEDGAPSGNERHAEALGAAARCVAAYKTNFWTTLEEPWDPSGLPRDVLICGDDAGAKRAVTTLVATTGFRPVDCGALANTRILDRMLALLFELDERHATRTASSWKFLG